MQISNIVLYKIITMENNDYFSIFSINITADSNFLNTLCSTDCFHNVKVICFTSEFLSTRRHVDSRRMKNSTVFKFSEKYVAVKMILLFVILILLLKESYTEKDCTTVQHV